MISEIFDNVWQRLFLRKWLANGKDSCDCAEEYRSVQLVKQRPPAQSPRWSSQYLSHMPLNTVFEGQEFWRWFSRKKQNKTKENNLVRKKVKKLFWIIWSNSDGFRGQQKKKMLIAKIRKALNVLVDFSQFSSVSQLCPTLQPHGLQHARPLCPSPTPRIYSNSCPLSQWCHPTISSSVILFSSCLQSFPASESFQMSQLFRWGGQSIGVSASASVLPTNTQDWSPLGWTGWISLKSKGLARVFSNTTVQKHQFFGA